MEISMLNLSYSMVGFGVVGIVIILIAIVFVWFVESFIV